MKKALSFAVALGLVAGVASVASAADLSINGDARWRGVYMNNVDDNDDNNPDHMQAMDQRYRFNCDLKINDDVMVNTRLVLADDIFGNKLTSLRNTTNATASDDYAASNGLNHTVDRANMSIKTMGGTWSFGRMDASWGNKFMGWGASVDRVKAAYKVADMTVVGYLQKDIEDDDAVTGNGDGDRDTWGALVVAKAGDTTWGVIANYVIDDSTAAKVSGKDTGYLADAYFTTKMGAAALMGEIFYSGGDLLENDKNDPILGGFLAGSMDMAPVTVKGIFAMWDGNDGGTGNRDCDNDFAPSLLIGTCNETAIIDFGSTTSGGDDSTWLLAAGADFKANDKLTLGAALGYLMATEKDGYCTTAGCEEEASLIEVDLTAQYQLAQNATYNLGIAYGDVDKFSAKDDAIIVIGNRVDVKW